MDEKNSIKNAAREAVKNYHRVQTEVPYWDECNELHGVLAKSIEKLGAMVDYTEDDFWKERENHCD